MTIHRTRREYQYGRLTRESLRDSPFEQFKLWLDQALASPIKDPTAMTVTTVDAAGRPWSRAVLLKGFDGRGFVYFTNLNSRKARETLGNRQVSLHFPWFLLDRQVSVGGVAEVLERAEVVSYFNSRPRDSQLAAWASPQSQPIPSREVLETEFAALQRKFAGAEVPTPEFWGGYRVAPHEFQFWQGGESRLHDRFRYLPNAAGDGWDIARLGP